MRELTRKVHRRYAKDVERMRRILAEQGFVVEPAMIEDAWRSWSFARIADHWFDTSGRLNDTQVLEALMTVLEPSEEPAGELTVKPEPSPPEPFVPRETFNATPQPEQDDGHPADEDAIAANAGASTPRAAPTLPPVQDRGNGDRRPGKDRDRRVSLR